MPRSATKESTGSAIFRVCFSAPRQLCGTRSCEETVSKFPRPRAHMHAHGASERADTHACPIQKTLTNCHNAVRFTN